MTADESIKVQERIIKNPSILLSETEKGAIKLGIEALRRIKDSRERRFVTVATLLLGETKE